MSDINAKVHQIVCRLGLRPRPRWGSLQRSPRPPSWILGVLLLRDKRGMGGKGEGKGGEKKGGDGGKGKEGEGKEGGGKGLGGIEPNSLLNLRGDRRH